MATFEQLAEADEVDKRDCKSMIAKPHTNAKFHAMMLTRARSNADEADSNPDNLAAKRRKQETTTLTIGLVARAAVSKEDVMEHCHKFDQVFKHLDTKNRRQFDRMTNALIVCAATYSGDISSFDSSAEASILMEVPDEFSNVTEVVLLNLTTRTKRANSSGEKKARAAGRS